LLDLPNEILMAIRSIGWRDAIDILLVTVVNYKILMMIRGTRAWRVVLGAIGFVGLLWLSSYLGLTTLHWILDKAAILAPLALVILLLPQLRHVLEGLATAKLLGIPIFPQNIGSLQSETEARTVEELVAATAELASSRVGALIVIERGAPLDEIIVNGVELNARVSAPLLGSIFYEGNPLHDGAVVIRKDLLVAAACRLPLSDSQRMDPNLHMRHRAGLGVAEAFDCLVIIVSEERGTISIAHHGRLVRLHDHQELRTALNRELRGEELVPKDRHRRQKPREREEVKR
jgi:diadenylate cyclase